jgi:hypothetical protein
MLSRYIRGGTPALRLSDEERERALVTLKAHYAEGRLSTDELEGRVEHVYRSGTQRDLAGYFRDLPLRGARGVIVDRVRRLQRAVLGMHLLTYLAINGSVVALWALTGEGAFWPALLLVPTTALLAWHFVASRALSRALGRRSW